MPTITLHPKDAVALAQEVYAVNSGDDVALQIFLQNKLFAKSKGSKTLLKAEVGGRIFRAATDTFGLAALGGDDIRKELFLVFRGTTEANNKADFVSDARIGLTSSSSGWPVHIGFNHAFTSMLREIRNFHKDLKSPISTVHCIGHSLGGAVATLAADWAYSSICKDVKLYTFGQPRVGLSMHALNLTRKLGRANVHRVYHTTDPVPMVPIFPYVHSPMPGMGHRIDSDYLITGGEAHKIAKYGKSVKGKQWNQLARGLPINNHEDAIREWLNSNRNQNPNCPKTFEWVERALIWLLAKCFAGVVNVLHLAAMGVHTFLDKLAWLLAKAYEIADDALTYVKMFIRKIMRILGVPESRMGKNPTRSFLRYILEALMKRAYELAQAAIRQL